MLVAWRGAGQVVLAFVAGTTGNSIHVVQLALCVDVCRFHAGFIVLIPPVCASSVQYQIGRNEWLSVQDQHINPCKSYQSFTLMSRPNACATLSFAQIGAVNALYV